MVSFASITCAVMGRPCHPDRVSFNRCVQAGSRVPRPGPPVGRCTARVQGPLRMHDFEIRAREIVTDAVGNAVFQGRVSSACTIAVAIVQRKYVGSPVTPGCGIARGARDMTQFVALPGILG